MSVTAAAYRHCLRVTRSAARNFYYAFLFLPTPRRKGMSALYAFCRRCDDIADGPGTADARRTALDRVRRDLDSAVSGRPEGPVFVALADTLDRFGVRPGDLRDVVDGVEMDLTMSRYETFADLYRYCYHVAAAVGLASIEVFGNPAGEAAREPAEALGIAMQLTNILRDVAEDAGEGRVYLPQEWLGRHGCTADGLVAGAAGGDIAAVLRHTADQAWRYYGLAERLYGLLDRSARACPATLAGIYAGILEQIERDGHTTVLLRRARLGPAEKLAVAISAWIEHGIVGRAR